MEYIRDTCKKVALKCLNNSQNITDNFFNEIEKYSTDNFSLCILKTYGISQVPDTNDYIMVLEYAENAARKQPFVDHAHDNVLALDICNGIRPEINEQEAPKCYIDLMNKCWDSKPQNRPNAIEIDKLILSFRDNFIAGKGEQFKELEISIENNQSSTHSQAIYTSRLLNPFTKNLPHYDENKISDCLDCAITN
ncbi:uncharacterized protein OCT59_023755 [Rhizophagus irregularis]|uniref:uncharacterized protein n=1 Tax=Rhizophagus irregularis TaxID=588596 RepID=UPI00332919F2|nr:hypothetical protein OCT59_023755 [Rhizophagus irregularis]